MKSQPKMQQHKKNLDDKSSQIKVNVLDKAIFTLIKTCIWHHNQSITKGFFSFDFSKTNEFNNVWHIE